MKMLARVNGSSNTYAGIQPLHRRLQSVGGDPCCPVIVTLPVTDLANGIGHVLKSFGELFQCEHVVSPLSMERPYRFEL